MERVVGIEPTFPAWKAGVLADIRYPHIFKSLLTFHTVSILSLYSSLIHISSGTCSSFLCTTRS